MKYLIEVHSIGYEDTSLVVEDDSLAKARQKIQFAVLGWLEHNDADVDTVDLPFTRIRRVASDTPVSRLPGLAA